MSKQAKSTSGEVHKAAVTLGSRWGKEGGPARARALSHAERQAIARKGGHAKARGK